MAHIADYLLTRAQWQQRCYLPIITNFNGHLTATLTHKITDIMFQMVSSSQFSNNHSRKMRVRFGFFVLFCFCFFLFVFFCLFVCLFFVADHCHWLIVIWHTVFKTFVIRIPRYTIVVTLFLIHHYCIQTFSFLSLWSEFSVTVSLRIFTMSMHTLHHFNERNLF